MSRRNRSDDDGFQSLAPDIQKAFGEAMREVVGSYYAGENSRYLPSPPGVSITGSGADYHYRNETQFLRMVERARYFDRDNMVVGQGVSRLVANVVQEGFTIDPDTGDEGLDAEWKARWNAWASSAEACDFEGERDWSDIEQLSLRAQIVDGDILAVPTAAGSIWWREAHALRNPFGQANSKNCVHGVELDKDRRRIAYNFLPDPPSPLNPVSPSSEFQRVLARDAEGYRQVWHLYQPKRFSQARGVTAFAPSVVPVQYHEDLQFATLLKAKVASFIAIFRQYDVDANNASNRTAGERSYEMMGDGSMRTVERSGLAQTVKGDPGEKLQGFAPNIPNPEFFPHAALILSIIAINLDLPLCVFLLDPKQTNFSGWRGAIDQARQRFRQIQLSQVRKLHAPAYCWQVRRWLATDAAARELVARSKVDAFAHTWHPPRWPYIEPTKDAAAADARITRNLAPARVVFAEAGYDYDDAVVDIVGDRVQLIRAALAETRKLNQEFPEAKVDWREVAYGRSGDSTSATIAAMANEPTPNEPANDAAS